MLYSFHHSENSKKPNSVDATYVITGVQHPPEPPATTGDDIMQSSPYISSSMPNQDDLASAVTTSSIILVREEDLEGNATIDSSGMVLVADTGYRCEIDVPVNFVYSHIQSPVRSSAGSQCLDGCQS